MRIVWRPRVIVGGFHEAVYLDVDLPDGPGGLRFRYADHERAICARSYLQGRADERRRPNERYRSIE